MMPYREGRYYDKTIDTLNKLAGLNKENIKLWLKEIKVRGDGKDQPCDEFIEKVASLAIASPLPIARAILTEYWNVCIVVGKNPEKSRVFVKRMITMAIPAHIFTLQEKASDLSLRASASKQKEDKTTGTVNEGF